MRVYHDAIRRCQKGTQGQMKEKALRKLDRVYDNGANVGQSLITFLPKLVVIITGLILVVDSALAQFEISITGGSLLFNPRPHIVLVLGLVAMLLLKGRFQSSPLLPVALLLLSY